MIKPNQAKGNTATLEENLPTLSLDFAVALRGSSKDKREGWGRIGKDREGISAD